MLCLEKGTSGLLGETGLPHAGPMHAYVGCMQAHAETCRLSNTMCPPINRSARFCYMEGVTRFSVLPRSTLQLLDEQGGVVYMLFPFVTKKQ